MGSVGSMDVNFAVGWWEGRRDKSASRLDFGLVILCESRRELPWSSLPIIPVCFTFLILVDDKHLYGCARSCNAEIIVFTFIFAPFCLLVIFFVTSRTLFEVEVWFFFFELIIFVQYFDITFFASYQRSQFYVYLRALLLIHMLIRIIFKIWILRFTYDFKIIPINIHVLKITWIYNI